MHIGVRGFIACMFSVGLAIGVIVAVGGLFYIQVSQCNIVSIFKHKVPGSRMSSHRTTDLLSLVILLLQISASL